MGEHFHCSGLVMIILCHFAHVVNITFNCSSYYNPVYVAITLQDHYACWDLNKRGAVGETPLHLCLLQDTPVLNEISKVLIKLYPKQVLDYYEGEEYYGICFLDCLVLKDCQQNIFIFTPQSLMSCQGIVFIHGIRMGRWVVWRAGRWGEKVCPDCISDAISCRKLILGRNISLWVCNVMV